MSRFSPRVIQNGLYCLRCNQEKPASELTKLFVLWKPTDREPTPLWKLKGNYCTNCINGEKEQLGKRGAINFKEEPLVPHGQKEKVKI